MTMKKLVPLVHKERSLVSQLLLISDAPQNEKDDSDFSSLTGWSSVFPKNGISLRRAVEKVRKNDRAIDSKKPDDLPGSWRKVCGLNLDKAFPKMPEIKGKVQNNKAEWMKMEERDHRIKSIKKIVANHSHSADEKGRGESGEKTGKSTKSAPRHLVPNPVLIEDVKAKERKELSNAKLKLLMQKIPSLNQQIVDDNRLLERLSSRSQCTPKHRNPCHISLHYDMEGVKLRQNSNSSDKSSNWKSNDFGKSPSLAKKIISQSKLYQLQKSKRNAELYGRRDDYMRHALGTKGDGALLNSNAEHLFKDKSLSPLLVSVFRNENGSSINLPLNLKNRIQASNGYENLVKPNNALPSPGNTVVRELPIIDQQAETSSDITHAQGISGQQHFDWKFSPILPPILKHGDKVLNQSLRKSTKRHFSNVTVITQGRQKAGVSSTSINKIRVQLAKPTVSTRIVLPHILGEKTRAEMTAVKSIYRGN